MLGFAILFTTVASCLAGVLPVEHQEIHSNSDKETFPADDGKIVGGFLIDITRVPYQVSIQTNRRQHFCGGSLIYPNIVLTAAHCVEDDTNPRNYLLYFGSSDRTQGGVAIPARTIKYHEYYIDDSVENDIALIRMTRAAPMSNKIRVIPMATMNPSPGTTTLASGWGKLDENDPDSAIPVMLRGVYLKTISLQSCQNAYDDESVQNTNICAYTEGKDTCQGDSGGPLVANNTLVGVVSWGIGCAERGNPGVYASVARYRSWIARTIPTL